MSNTLGRKVRLQKFIADCGICSRRKAEELIVQGRVRINEEVVTQLGTKVDPVTDIVFVDGQVLDLDSVEKIYLVLNKPRGFVTTLDDPEGRKTVMEFVREFSERIYPVGRLDYLSEGLLLMTNDGDMANLIMHPRYEVTKVYEVKIFGAVTEPILAKLRAGTTVDGVQVKPKSVRVIEQLQNKTWVEFRLGEGRNREIRKICEDAEITIDKLRRVAIGNLTVDGLRPGNYQMLSKGQLLKALGMNDDGTPKGEAREYLSKRKTINLKRKGVQPATAADDREFKKFRRDVYFQTVKSLKETKVVEAKKERAESWRVKEEKHQKRIEKKVKRVANKKASGRANVPKKLRKK